MKYLRSHAVGSASRAIRRRPFTNVAAISLVATLVIAAVANDAAARSRAPSGGAAADEPGIARVSFIEGNASYFRADGDDWTGVSVNAPLVTGDRFYSGPNSRTEIQLAPGVYARLSSETEVDMLDLGPDLTQVSVRSGTATFRIRQTPGNRQVELDSPNGAIVARERGVYRVNVDPDGNDTKVFVRSGDADVYVGDAAYQLAAGRAANIEGTGADAHFAAWEENGEDDWDRWEDSRAARVDHASSYRHVSAAVYGAEDLDDYGTWSNDARYGDIWRPTHVAADWAPFTDGRWVWQDPWGWTWVDYQPWGWAPCHYGRWVHVNDDWAWAPGPIVTQPVYAPAVVGFFGVGAGVSVGVSLGVGPVGWVAAGFGEPIVPWWGGFGGVTIGRPWWGGWGGPRIVNNTVIRNTNITNINVNNIRYANLAVPSAPTLVSRDAFVSGQVRRAEARIQPAVLQQARPIAGHFPAMPTVASLPAVDPARARANAIKPPAGVLQRAAVTVHSPAPAPAKFQDRLKLVESRKAPVSPAQLRTLAHEQPNAKPIVPTIAARQVKPVVPQLTAKAEVERGEPGRGRPQVGRDEQTATGTKPDVAQPPARMPGESAQPPRPSQREQPPASAAVRPDQEQRQVAPQGTQLGQRGQAVPQAARPGDRSSPETQRPVVRPRNETAEPGRALERAKAQPPVGAGRPPAARPAETERRAPTVTAHPRQEPRVSSPTRSQPVRPQEERTTTRRSVPRPDESRSGSTQHRQPAQASAPQPQRRQPAQARAREPQHRQPTQARAPEPQHRQPSHAVSQAPKSKPAPPQARAQKQPKSEDDVSTRR